MLYTGHSLRVGVYSSAEVLSVYSPGYVMSRGRTDRFICFLRALEQSGGARGLMVIVVGNGHGDTSSNPGRDWLHFT